MTLTEQMTQLASQAKAASRELAKLSTRGKNACLVAMADAIKANSAAIKEANARDMETAAGSGLPSAMLDRLKLDDQRITTMAKGLREVAALWTPSEGFWTNARGPTDSNCKRFPRPSASWSSSMNRGPT